MKLFWFGRFFFPEFSRDYQKSAVLLACYWNLWTPASQGHFFLDLPVSAVWSLDYRLSIYLLHCQPCRSTKSSVPLRLAMSHFTHYAHIAHLKEAPVENCWYCYCSCPSVSCSSTLLPRHKLNTRFKPCVTTFWGFCYLSCSIICLPVQ